MTHRSKNPNVVRLPHFRLGLHRHDDGLALDSEFSVEIAMPAVAPANPNEERPRLYLPGCRYALVMLENRTTGKPLFALVPEADGKVMMQKPTGNNAVGLTTKIEFRQEHGDTAKLVGLLRNTFNMPPGFKQDFSALVNTNTGRITVLCPGRKALLL